MSAIKKFDSKFNLSISEYPTVEQYASLTCIESKGMYIQYMPKYTECSVVTVYHNCYKTIISCMFRHATATILAETSMLDRFSGFVTSQCLPEIEDLMEDYLASYSIYYNHLNAKQQNEQDKYRANPDNRGYYIEPHCKSECQIGLPIDCKTRCICGVCVKDKIVCGRYIYDLENLVRNSRIKGYSAGKNWIDKEKTLKAWRDKMYQVINNDINGCDRSIIRLKGCVHFAIYTLCRMRAKSRYDIPSNEEFDEHAFKQRVKLLIKNHNLMSDDDFLNQFIEIFGTVYSGKSCTTLLNTLCVIFLLRFINEIILHIKYDDYDMQVSGDDANNAISVFYTKEQISKAYYAVFCPEYMYANTLLYPLLTHGLGLRCDDIYVGDVDDVMFCSTVAFYCEGCASYKLLRELSKYVRSSPYSVKAANFSSTRLDAYKQQIYLADSRWISSIPIYSAINNKLNTGATVLPIVGPVKKCMVLDDEETEYYKRHFSSQYHAEERFLKQWFENDDVYRFIGKSQVINDCCVESSFNMFSTKYGLERNEVLRIHKLIEAAQDDILISELTDGFNYFVNEYKAGLKI